MRQYLSAGVGLTLAASSCVYKNLKEPRDAIACELDVELTEDVAGGFLIPHVCRSSFSTSRCRKLSYSFDVIA